MAGYDTVLAVQDAIGRLDAGDLHRVAAALAGHLIALGLVDRDPVQDDDRVAQMLAEALSRFASGDFPPAVDEH